jgi:hypothetical protein
METKHYVALALYHQIEGKSSQSQAIMRKSIINRWFHPDWESIKVVFEHIYTNKLDYNIDEVVKTYKEVWGSDLIAITLELHRDALITATEVDPAAKIDKILYFYEKE